jgi:hypothetical protein
VRKSFVAPGIAAAALSLGAVGAVQADVLPGGVEGCVATSPGGTSPTGVVYNGSCSYTATRTGGYAIASQTWSVTIYKDATKQVVLHSFSSAKGDAPCNTSPITQPGNVIALTVGNGVGAVGNPFPSATDGQLNPSDGCTNF